MSSKSKSSTGPRPQYKARRDANYLGVRDFIVRYSDEHGFPPSTREIAEANQISGPGHVHFVLRKLEKQGFIELTPNKSRGIKVLIRGETA